MKTLAAYAFTARLCALCLVMIVTGRYGGQSAIAQSAASAHKITASDSSRFKHFLDSADAAPVFSSKRQRYLDSALSVVPWKASLWQQKAMPLFKSKKYSLGRPYLDSAVKYDAHKYLDYRAFMKCIFQKDYESALADFRECKLLIGEGGVMDHSYNFYIGLCYLQLNVFDSAEYYLTVSIEHQKSSSGSDWIHPLDLYYLGIVHYEQDRFEDAITTFDSCLKRYPRFSDAKYYKAICFGRLNKPEQANALVKEAGEDFKNGYTINEDNVVYEMYPYQVNKFYFLSN